MAHSAPERGGSESGSEINPRDPLCFHSGDAILQASAWPQHGPGHGGPKTVRKLSVRFHYVLSAGMLRLSQLLAQACARALGNRARSGNSSAGRLPQIQGCVWTLWIIQGSTPTCLIQTGRGSFLELSTASTRILEFTTWSTHTHCP